MLSVLQIQNFALIERLSVEFGPGLTILTGETGAGKSIIFGALQLILGGRASADIIRTGEKETAVEALFQFVANSPGAEITQRIRELGVEIGDEGEMVLRRVIPAEGRNRCFINGSPVTLTMLDSAGEFLVDIHGQHQHQRLLYPDNHLEILDDFGELLKHRKEVVGLIDGLRQLEARWTELSRSDIGQRDRVDLLRFQIREIREINPVPREDLTLEEEAALLATAEERHAMAHGAHEELYESEGALVDGLAAVSVRMDRLAELDPTLRETAEGFRSLMAQAEDAARQLQKYADAVDFDPDRQRTVQDRLDVIQTMKKKYGGSIEAVLAHQERAATELEEFSGRDEVLEKITREIEVARSRVAAETLKLSDERKKTAARLGRAVEKELSGLGMEKVGFVVALRNEENPDGFVKRNGRRLQLFDDGVDRAEFEFEPNVGEGPRPLARIVSGGELSRVMLAIKTVLADRDRVPSLVFDEVDVGIGGAVAEVVGQKLKAISRIHQVLCITHLPQIAALADTHFRIEKEESGNRTRTTIRQLAPEERVDEIARMSGGRKITDATRQHAREMLGIKA